MGFQRSTKVSNVFSDRTAGLARYFLNLSNRAAATSALCFPYERCTNCISENKIGSSPGIFLVGCQCKLCPLEQWLTQVHEMLYNNAATCLQHPPAPALQLHCAPRT